MSNFNDILDDLQPESSSHIQLSPKAQQILRSIGALHATAEIGIIVYLIRIFLYFIGSPYLLFSSFGVRAIVCTILFVLALNVRREAMETYKMRNLDKNWPILRDRLILMIQIGLGGTVVSIAADFVYNFLQ